MHTAETRSNFKQDKQDCLNELDIGEIFILNTLYILLKSFSATPRLCIEKRSRKE